MLEKRNHIYLSTLSIFRRSVSFLNRCLGLLIVRLPFLRYFINIGTLILCCSGHNFINSQVYLSFLIQSFFNSKRKFRTKYGISSVNGLMLFNVEVMLVTQNLLKQNRKLVSATLSYLCKYKIPFVYKCKLPYLITPFFKQPEQVVGVFEILTPKNHLLFFRKLLMTFSFIMKVAFCSIHFLQLFS